jgi:hypothetical protein
MRLFKLEDYKELFKEGGIEQFAKILMEALEKSPLVIIMDDGKPLYYVVSPQFMSECLWRGVGDYLLSHRFQPPSEEKG